ncbi:MAG: hypothetical protein AAGG38_07485 [Planctomycetota bacterium]
MIRRPRSAAVAGGLFLLSGCVAVGLYGGESRADEPLGPDTGVTRWVDPQATDPAISAVSARQKIAGGGAEHLLAFDPSVQSRGQLLVYLPGSGGTPAASRKLAEHASSLGYHVASLAYHSWPPIGRLTRGREDQPGLAEALRRERLYGEDTTGFIEVPRAEAVVYRLVKLLEYAERTAPGVGWGGYLRPAGHAETEPGDAASRLRWSVIAVAGHSQGAGHALMLGRDHGAERVVMLAGPSDRVGGQPAPWIAALDDTPLAGRCFQLVHRDDRLTPSALRSAAAAGLDRFGPPADTGAVPEVAGTTSHRLLTSAPPRRRGGAHGAVATDRQTPLDDDGRPVLADVWTYLLTAPTR